MEITSKKNYEPVQIAQKRKEKWKEVDFENKLIYVTHTLRYDNYGDENKFHIFEPKAESAQFL